jgi:hypothetical protein
LPLLLKIKNKIGGKIKWPVVLKISYFRLKNDLK